uniref:Uncharacterized protein n=1 Tax=Euplotes harpa TaxID=151035 RepID=A0A7S3JA69_9SPIT|mmetsp:Transcript_28799/g.32914  ORF Transcript_28799/g.32914 Transcript_28799/m.32914 type:complete len:126 (+) Transcript_28799:16-393(+)|eukprot:CAMPEP_0168342936 /NCGR_PEP_ID=MMETSP0213-20121227/15734_1 /TAXON_ID=151035 /ORGANISM="Euplotes harpa, Strain FSP1.4" /LENGTH=125 /DNA_ID=CAMNT_0008350015 /DNA_START=12 /DNA_END=389 /DNA_ORIENTATION=+
MEAVKNKINKSVVTLSKRNNVVDTSAQSASDCGEKVIVDQRHSSSQSERSSSSQDASIEITPHSRGDNAGEDGSDHRRPIGSPGDSDRTADISRSSKKKSQSTLPKKKYEVKEQSEDVVSTPKQK